MDTATRVTVAFIIAAVMISGGMLALGTWHSRQQRQAIHDLTLEAQDALIGRRAPVFWAVAGGDSIPLPPPPGRPVVLVFGEADCSACRRLLSALRAYVASETSDAGVDVLVIDLGIERQLNLDGPGAQIPVARAVHPDSARGRYRITGLPTVAWIDPSRRISDVKVGYAPNLGVGHIFASGRE